MQPSPIEVPSSSLPIIARALGLSCLAAWPFITIGCAPSMPPSELGRPTGYDRLEAASPGVDGFERKPTDLDPAEVVPRDLLQGPHHVVRSVRLEHNFLYTYQVDNAHGALEVTGRGLLRKRVMELEALAEFKEKRLGGTKLYAYEVANAVGEPIEDTLQILRHPIRTFTNIPKSVVASFKALKEMKEMGRTYLEDDYIAEFIGLSGEKREWAGRLGVDPYTTNPHVQAKLTRISWLSLAGDMTVTLATLPIPAGGATIAMSVVGATSGINDQLEDVAPEDIRVSSRAWLRDELGIEGDLAERFLEHPWYSPSRQDTLIRALSRMGGAEHRDRFIELAARADEPHEAYAFTRLALMLAECHERRAAIDEIFVAHDLIMAHTVEGDIVLPLYMDHAYWTAEVALAEAGIVLDLEAEHRIGAPLLIVSGTLSARATRELTQRGWEVVDGLEELWLAELDLAMYRPGEEDEGRILPEFGH
jgi:hypothetical protein